MGNTDVAALRENYTQGGLERESLPESPWPLFRTWFEQAVEAELPEPNAFVLATIESGRGPSTRLVLMKAYDERGIVFYTNYESAKARQIEANPAVSVTFPWVPLERQVHLQGQAVRVSATESMKYFLSRPRGSRLGAWVSQQSSVISSRKLLEMKFDEIRRKFGEGDIPLPSFWGGYRIEPHRFEFWQGRPNRLHDRFEYRKSEDSWDIQRLSP